MLLGAQSIFFGGWFPDNSIYPENVFVDGWWLSIAPPTPPTPPIPDRIHRGIKYYAPDSRCSLINDCYVPPPRVLGSYVAPQRTTDR
jgi:hypothetical protein